MSLYKFFEFHMIQNKLLSVDLCSKKKPKTFRIKSVFQGLYPGTAFLKEQCSVAVFSVRDFTTADKRTHTRMQARILPSLLTILQTFVNFDAYHSRLLYLSIVT